MTMTAEELEALKTRRFKRMFGTKYSLRLLEMQVWNELDGRNLAEVSFIFGGLMSALEIQDVCNRIAKWMGGELYGTVNLDFSGTNPSLEMMVEIA